MNCLIICMARDGSTSLRNLLWNFFELNNRGSENDKCKILDHDIGYVTDNHELWPALRMYILKANSWPLLSIFCAWRQQVEISHGLAFALPAVRVAFGQDVKIVRVVRDRNTHVDSLVNQSFIDPEHWIGYSEEQDGSQREFDHIRRITAVDYGEVDANAWSNLSVRERFEWFIDKQCELTDRHTRLFKNVFTVRTEDISKSEVIAELGRFVNPDWRDIPKPVHIHKLGGASLDGMSVSERKYIEQVWQQFDLEQVVRDPEYALRFCIEDIEYRFSDDPEMLKEMFDRALERISNANRKNR